LNQNRDDENDVTLEDHVFPKYHRSDAENLEFEKYGSFSTDEKRFYSELYDNYKEKIYNNNNYLRHSLGTILESSAQVYTLENKYQIITT
jgi:hypothetical protein